MTRQRITLAVSLVGILAGLGGGWGKTISAAEGEINFNDLPAIPGIPGAAPRPVRKHRRSPPPFRNPELQKTRAESPLAEIMLPGMSHPQSQTSPRSRSRSQALPPRVPKNKSANAWPDPARRQVAVEVKQTPPPPPIRRAKQELILLPKTIIYPTRRSGSKVKETPQVKYRRYRRRSSRSAQELPILSGLTGTAATPAAKRSLSRRSSRHHTTPRVIRSNPQTGELISTTQPAESNLSAVPTLPKIEVRKPPTRQWPRSQPKKRKLTARITPSQGIARADFSATLPLPAPTVTSPSRPRAQKSSSRFTKREPEAVQLMVGSGGVRNAGLGGVVATYRGKPITRLDLYAVMERTYGRQALDRLLMPLLLRDELARRKLQLTDAEIDNLLRQHLKKMTPSDAKNKKTIDANVLTRRWFGMNVAQYRKIIVWPEAAIRKLVADSLQATGADVANYFFAHQERYMLPEKVSLSHILISPMTYLPKGLQKQLSPGKEEWDKAYAAALKVQMKLRSGYDFGTLATEVSQDKNTRAKKGFLGEIPRGQLPRELEEVAFGLQEGHFSELVKTIYGYHILYLNKKTPARVISFTKIKARVREDYLAELAEMYSTRLLTKLKQQAMKDKILSVEDGVLKGLE